MTSFNDFGLAEPILRALNEEKYVTPTPIQTDAIPPAVAGRDLIGIAQTGTGKTAAFALPILNRLANNKKPLEKKGARVLVLSPTRELSGQILQSFRTYGRHLRMQSALVIGGVPMGRQVRDLMHGLDVLVATPGRLLDLVKSNGARLNNVEVLVLDEADRMLDMGFIHDIRAVVAKLPKERQTLFFSATMPREIADLASQMLTDPVRVSVTPVSSTAERIAQSIILVDKPAKARLLVETLRESAVGQTLVFTRTKHGADKVVKQLHNAGLSAEAIHGNKSQNQRERVLGAFRNGSLKTLVATDIAARGIDVDGISLVINFDLPNIPESYVHRIGRTARAGADGVAISFCDHEERAFLRDIEKLIGMKLPSTDKRANPQQADEAAPHHRPQQNRGGRNGNRNGQQQRRGGGQGRGGQQRHANGNGGGNRNGQNGEQRQATGEGQNGQSRQANGRNGHNGQQRQANGHNGNQNGHNGQQRRNGKPHRNGKPNHNGKQQHGGGQNRHAPAASSNPDNIGTVGFMRQPSRQSQGGDGHHNSR